MKSKYNLVSFKKIIWALPLFFLFICGCATVPVKKNNSLQISENAYINYKAASELIVPVDKNNYYTYINVLKSGWENEDKSLEKFLSDNEPALKELQKGLEGNELTLPAVNTPEERRAILFYLDRFTELARLLSLKSKFYIYKKDYGQAVKYCFDTIKFGQHLEKGANLLAKRIGMAIESSGYKNLRDAIFQTKDYSRILENIKAIKNNKDTRIHLKKILEKELYNTRFNVSPLLLSEKEWQEFKESYEASGYTEQDVIKSIKVCYLDALKYIDLPYNEGLRLWHLSEETQNPVRYALMPILRNIYTECGRLDTEIAATSLIIGLEYYNYKNKKYPEKLLDLVPKYITSLPLDPFTAEPFIYNRMGRGWKMYSIGSDLKNDFGQKNSYFSKDSTGDIIFFKE